MSRRNKVKRSERLATIKRRFPVDSHVRSSYRGNGWIGVIAGHEERADGCGLVQVRPIRSMSGQVISAELRTLHPQWLSPVDAPVST